jgi:hypothetical protein
MPHLSLETLARLVDETPDTEESQHLETCEACRIELAALRDDVQALSMLPDMMPAPDAWHAIEGRLVDEGLIRERGRFALNTPRPAQLAAAVVLFLAGSLAGRMSAAPLPVMTAQIDQAAAPATSAGAAYEAGYSAGLADGGRNTDAAPSTEPGARLAAADNDAPAVDAAAASASPRPDPGATTRLDSPMRLASSGPTLPTSMEEAAALLRQTEDLYLSALTRYAELATQSEAGDPIARLAALQSIVMTTNAALNQTPADPVINGVHLAALAQRDATLAQVAAASGERWY